MSTTFSTLPPAAAIPPAPLMRLIPSSLFVLPLSASLILLTDCLEVSTAIFIVGWTCCSSGNLYY